MACSIDLCAGLAAGHSIRRPFAWSNSKRRAPFSEVPALPHSPGIVHSAMPWYTAAQKAEPIGSYTMPAEQTAHWSAGACMPLNRNICAPGPMATNFAKDGSCTSAWHDPALNVMDHDQYASQVIVWRGAMVVFISNCQTTLNPKP
jgi:hypothetical protein